MMKRLNLSPVLKACFFLFMASLVMLSCKDDEDDNTANPPAPVNELAGTYSFVLATFNDPVTIIVNGDTNHYQVGDDASLFVGGGLLGAAPCDNAENAALQLRSDYTSHYVCQGESNESQQGTWSSNADYTSLTLNISNPNDFLVTIKNVVKADNKLTGEIDPLPLPFDTSIPVGEPLPGGGINFQTANVNVEFSVIE